MDSGNPPAPTNAETPGIEGFKKEGPGHGVEGLGDVKLEEQLRDFLLAQEYHGPLHVLEVVHDRSALYVSILVGSDQFPELRRQPDGEQLG